MNAPSAYLHTLDGRIRIKLSAVKRSSDTASLVEERLGRCDGVLDVRANPVTGNVLILYDSEKVSQTAVMRILRPFGADRSGGRAAARTVRQGSAAVQRLTETVVSTLVETVMRHFVAALI